MSTFTVFHGKKSLNLDENENSNQEPYESATKNIQQEPMQTEQTKSQVIITKC